jgi:hypothetical protein
MIKIVGDRNIIDINHKVNKLIVIGDRNEITINSRQSKNIIFEGNNNKIYSNYPYNHYNITDFGRRNKLYKISINEYEYDETNSSNSISDEIENEKKEEENKEEINENSQINNEVNENNNDIDDANEDENDDENIIIRGFGIISNVPLEEGDNLIQSHNIFRNIFSSSLSRIVLGENNNIDIGDINNILSELIDIPFKSTNKGAKEGNEKCVICYENFKEKEIVKMTSCFHIYHFKCIKKWVENKKQLREEPDCPICRRKL